MAKKITVVLAPVGIYHPKARLSTAYVTREDSRWAAHREEGQTSWNLLHRRSGLMIGSIFPPVRATQAYVLRVIKAIEAHPELDLEGFDTIPQIEEGATEAPGFPPGRQSTPELLKRLRELARDAKVAG